MALRFHVWGFLCLWLGLCVATQAQNTYSQKTRTFHTAEEFARLTQGKVQINRLRQIDVMGATLIGTRYGIVRRDHQDGTLLPYPILTQLPSNEITVLVHEQPAVLWIGTKEGLVVLNTVTREAKYLAGKRWLPDDHVVGIGIDKGVAWIETSQGFSRLEYKQMTLADKSRAFVERVQQRHNRWGQTADSHLRVPGDLSTNQMVSSDNDGLWTAMYVAAECFRYKVTGERDARENARVGMQAILRLEEITGIPGFPARSFIKVGTDIQPGDGEWHDTPDKVWRWKGDTSSDEIVGHYFVYPIYHDLVADEAEKPKLRAALDRITNHILDNNYQLLDVDGKRTRWGWWGLDAIWEDPDETGLRALHILSHLRVAIYLTTNPTYRAKYQAAYDDLIKNHKYHLLTRNQKIMVPGHINHSDDELAFLSYYPLLSYETDPKLRAVYQQSLERSWQIERPERNPLWNFIYAVGCEAKEFDRESSIRTLQEIPMDQIAWTVKNSHRQDVPIDPLSDRFRRKQALIVLPYDELPMSKWNGNPYNLDGGNGGRSEDDGAYFLLPYWMGRYHKLIGE
ncbi:MAG TPA: hypothetical protein VFZ34_05645 [Blastocatellia bacterium]|nr:hypothetical protein [Blastocatellia bacterium]